jgi:hypothetical protein
MPKSKPPPKLRTWLAADLGASLVCIQTTGPVGTIELASLFACLASYFQQQRRLEAPPKPVLLHRCSRFCDARITFSGTFDPRNVAPLMEAMQAQRNADAPEIERLKRESWLRRSRLAGA